MSARRVTLLVLAAFTGGLAAAIYGLWLWVDHGLARVRW